MTGKSTEWHKDYLTLGFPGVTASSRTLNALKVKPPVSVA